MRLILMPRLLVSWEPRVLPAALVDEAQHIELPDDSNEPLRSAIERAISDHPWTMERDASVDAPPFGPGSWWLAWIERHGDTATVTSCELAQFYGIQPDGLVRFEPHLYEITIADFVRALDEGHYPTSQRTLVITRSGEFGGNGAGVESLAEWLLTFAPGVLASMGIERVKRRHNEKKQTKLEELADSWTSRNILHPTYLRRFVETRRRWYPNVLAERLGLSPEAARRLLAAIGYEPGEDDVMELKTSWEALRARDTWISGETTDYYAEVHEDIEDYLGG